MSDIIEYINSNRDDKTKYTNFEHVEVMDNVVIGSFELTRNPDRMKKEGFTHILNCCEEGSCGKAKKSLEYLCLNAKDNDGYKILENHFDKAKEFIDNALATGGKVYVHCRCGKNRSATIAVAYIVYKKKESLFDVAKRCLELRPIILKNNNFIQQLIDYEETLLKS